MTSYSIEMKITKRAWTRAEKSLFATPLVFGLLAGATLLWRSTEPVNIEVDASASINHLSFSPDGKKLLVFFSNFQPLRQSGQIYDLETRSKICNLTYPPIPPSSKIQEIFFRTPSWSPDGTRLVAGYNDGSVGTTKIPEHFFLGSHRLRPKSERNWISKIALWDTRSGQLTGSFPYNPPNEDSRSSFLTFSADGQKLNGDLAPASIFDATTGQRLRLFKSRFANPDEVRRNRHNGMLAEVDHYRTDLQVVDFKSQKILWTLHANLLEQLQWREDMLAVHVHEPGGKVGLRLWDSKANKPLLSPPTFNIRQTALNPGKKILAYLNCKDHMEKKEEEELVVWDYRQHRVLWRITPNSALRSLQWSPDGKWLSVVSQPNDSWAELLVFDQAGNQRFKWESTSETTCWSPDSQKIAALTTKNGQKPQLVLREVDAEANPKIDR